MQKWIAWLLCVAWMAVIFAMSAMPGDVSGEQSGSIARVLISLITALWGEDAVSRLDWGMLEWCIRKAAHMAEYAILFMLSRRALRLSGVQRASAAALVLCAAYAATDEFHQCFTDGRSPSVVDVGIDTVGASLGWLFCAVWTRLRGAVCARRRARQAS